MRNKNRRWLFSWVILWTYLQLLYCEANEKDLRTGNNKNGTGVKETRGLFSPRMDYEQWKPILNGDPLKNDPTFDYVPPIVESVRYWRDTNHRKLDSPSNSNQKKDILLLGVSSKKPSTSSNSDNVNRREYFDPFLKYVSPYKETTYKEPNYYQRHRPYLLITSPHFTPSHFLNKLTERPPISNEAIPYTMLLPPPVPSKPTTVATVTRRPSSVSVDHANLIFHSTTSGLTDWLSSDKYTTAESSNLVTWKIPVSQEPLQNNIIDKQEKTYFKNKTEEQIGSPNVMRKGQVEDEAMDVANTYVNIGKLEAHMDSVSGIGISSVSVKPPNFGDVIRPISVPSLGEPTEEMKDINAIKSLELINPLEPIETINTMQPIVNPMFTPKRLLSTMTMKTLETMQTMQPPPILQKESFNNIKLILQNEITQPSLASLLVTTVTSTTSRITAEPTPMVTTPKPTTTTASSLTTDPLFKHYKQPMEPIRGPMYLIIQGHSKVKTYGPSKQIHGISIQESNEIPTNGDREFGVKHLHSHKKDDGGGSGEMPWRKGRSGNLQTLTHVVQTGLGAIDFGAIGKNGNIKEIEREVEYKVSSKEEDTSERYLKGFVESGALTRKVRDD